MGKSIPVLLVTGAPGVGKTTLVKEMGEQLFHAGVAHAVVDIDELARVRPAVPDEGVWAELTVANLRVMWPNYEALGVERVILAGIVQSAAIIDAYRAAIPGSDLTVVRLRASVDTLHARLQHREPGSVRTFLLGVTASLDTEIADLDVEDLTVDNDPDQPIGDLARGILEWLGWLRGDGPGSPLQNAAGVSAKAAVLGAEMGEGQQAAMITGAADEHEAIGDRRLHPDARRPPRVPSAVSSKD